MLSQACERVAVVAKPDVVLPPLECERWDEPAEPRHPLTGIVHALERAGGAVLVCAADMPFVTVAACRALIDADGDVAVAEAAGRLHPVLAVYSPAVLDRLRAAPTGVALQQLLVTLAPARVPLPAAVVRGVNTPAELAEAERELRTSAA